MIELFNEDNLIGLQRLQDESVDCILTDPPYLYLKNQKIEREFDEQEFFNQCKRVIKKDGFIILFGRGSSFYRWNYILETIGFNFKEEIIWDKSYCTSPLMAISRVHETISIFSKGKGIIKKNKIPYLESKKHNLDSIIQDIKRMRSIFTSESSMKSVLEFLENNIVLLQKDNKLSTTVSSIIKTQDRCVSVINGIKNGMNEKTIIRTDRVDCETFTKFGVNSDKRQTGDRCVNVVQSIEYGLNEKTIIKEVRDHYTAIHPTQKPVRLLERLLQLVVSEGATVVDPFGGSFSTVEACINLGLNCKAWEIDEEYFNLGKKRIESIERTLFNSL
jgi:site-specific DNA-methyltransferase (adenine-specific)